MKKPAGFTLLELLVVLVIIGFSSSFVMPDLWRSHEKSQQHNILQEFALELNQYRIEAYRTGRPIELVKEKDKTAKTTQILLPKLPQGWVIETATTLRFLPTGVTNGASYKIKSPDRYWSLKLSPLDGEHEIHLL